MSQMVTRCPKCATAFRVTSTQLESAKGAVRCGSCLHIFKAQDYLVTSATPQAAAQISTSLPPLTTANTATKIDKAASLAGKPVTAKTAVKPTSRPTPSTEPKPVFDKVKALADEEDVLISDDMDKPAQKESTYEFDGFLDIDLHPKQTVSLFEREIKDTPDDDEAEQTDESWAEQLLDDTEEQVQSPKKNSSPSTPSIDMAHREQLNKSAGDNTSPAEEAGTSGTGAAIEAKNNPLVFSLVSDSDSESEPMFSDEFLKATNANAATSTDTADSDSYAAELFKEDLDNQPVAKLPAKSHKIRAFDSSRTALLMNIMPAPVEFTAKRMRHWYQRRLWPSLALLMALLLIFQIAYFKFDYFSRVEPYRTVYLLACPIVKCKVPTLVDTQKIVATNLIVRNHPNAEHALMVDAILINNAPFEQPFPDLLLAFSTLDDKPIAARRFTPKEYLGGELAGMDHIPQRQPVHITLELADPGPEAVNYHLSIP